MFLPENSIPGAKNSLNVNFLANFTLSSFSSKLKRKIHNNNNNSNHFFLPKINKVFLSSILLILNGNDRLEEDGKNREIVIEI